MLEPLSTPTLPPGIRSRFVDDINGLRMHVLEAGLRYTGRPCLLLLHGFPELAYSWRKIMLPLAAAGYHVVAPDLRGYGRTTGWDAAYDGNLGAFRALNIVRDVLGLVFALGYRSLAGVVGHDYGSPIAAWCALLRPDVVRTVALMSAPFAGPPALPFDTADAPPREDRRFSRSVHDDLAALDPPRKHYHWYYATRQANSDMMRCPQGIHAFLRAYYHHKSADWKANRPHKLESWSASELAKLPTYYVMELDKDMPSTVARHMPSPAEIAACTWLSEDELCVYAAEYTRTGFQGGLQWYRTRTSGLFDAEQEVFSGRTIDQPACFIAGRSDWGVYQSPGAFESMQVKACTRMLACHLVAGAGHWVQQEQPEAVVRLLVDFLRRAH
jgi:pimeloyl-ACP methyl ester carboxylesterase